MSAVINITKSDRVSRANMTRDGCIISMDDSVMIRDITSVNSSPL